MSESDGEEDWEQKDLLYEANNLNANVKNYLTTDGNSKEYLRILEGNLQTYLDEIINNEFNMTRSDGISKEGVVNDLRLNLEKIKERLAIGGKRRSKRHSTKRRRTKRHRRSNKRRKH